jgi:excisionase family DNA binding protein
MRSATYDAAETADSDELLTTGEAAKLLNASRQHIVDLCDTDQLPFVTVGTHRRIQRRDLEMLRTRTERLTRDQRRSLWLGYAQAGKLVTDTDGVLVKARENLAQLRQIHTRGQAERWLGEWEKLLGGPVDKILEALTSPSPRGRELRQNSPFAGVLSDHERVAVLESFRAANVRVRS